MQTGWRNGVLVVALAAGLIPVGLRAMAADTAFTGTVSDDMCGAKHTMSQGGSDADCTLMCVKAGSAYALVVGDKSYTLATTDKKAEAALRKLAGKRAVVMGDLAGQTLTVHSVAPAK